MDKKFFIKKFEELVNSGYVKTEDYEAVINEIAGHYSVIMSELLKKRFKK